MKNFAQPTIGWFVVSEADRAAANRYLTSLTSDGTRDELGFAPIHFAFADQFFPGTSVQHAELRYVFFVAWAYQEILERTAGQRFSVDDLLDIERRFSLRLMKTVKTLENSGISGWTKYQVGERPMVRASTIYWTALRSWKMASPVGGLSWPPTETQLRSMWPQLATLDDGDNGKLSVVSIFDGLPEPPARWKSRAGNLDFTLRRREAEYLLQKWRVLNDGSQPLLSRLAEAGVVTESLWSSEVRRVAMPAERPALVLAKYAASLACIARAAHSALVEAQRNEDRGLSESRHTDAFPILRDQHRDNALELDVDALRVATRIDKNLFDFIELVKGWLRNREPLDAIAKAMTLRERYLKESRAYLISEKRRRDWRKAPAVPLDYRWPVVRNMIVRVLNAS